MKKNKDALLTTLASQCFTCKHYRKNGKCRAFTFGIPSEVISNEVMHNDILPNQNGDFVWQSKIRVKSISTRKRQWNIDDNKVSSLDGVTIQVVEE